MARNGGAARKRGRLSRGGDFDRAYRDGTSEANRHLVLYVFSRTDEGSRAQGPRLGISVGRKVGNAVERNRVKRVLRECFWKLAGESAGSRDIVIVARPGVLELVDGEDSEAAAGSLQELLAAAGILGDRAA